MTKTRYEVQVYRDSNKVYEVWAESEDEVENLVTTEAIDAGLFKELENDGESIEVSINHLKEEIPSD